MENVAAINNKIDALYSQYESMKNGLKAEIKELNQKVTDTVDRTQGYDNQSAEHNELRAERVRKDKTMQIYSEFMNQLVELDFMVNGEYRL